jgi:hypothetical protein
MHCIDPVLILRNGLTPFYPIHGQLSPAFYGKDPPLKP